MPLTDTPLNLAQISALQSADDACAVFDSLNQQASRLGITLRPPPPFPTSCCGRGCHGCVWEGFYAAANYWCEEALLKLAPSSSPLP